MAKSTTYWCKDCGNELLKWEGRCPECGEWGTVEEVPRSLLKGRDSGDESGSGNGGSPGSGRRSRPTRLVAVDDSEHPRIASGLPEFDFVLGGGIVPGSLVLVGGAPGIGKSTILTQVASELEASGTDVLYVSGEESARQVKLRAQRIGRDAEQVRFMAETEINRILAEASDLAPRVLVVDSIQTLHDASVDSAPGNLKQVKECAGRLQQFAKSHETAVFVVGHVTKGGRIAGPKTLEHVVDTVVYFEHTEGGDHRIMRAVKNRFGSVDEIGVFRMTAAGLEAIENPSELFLADRRGDGPGSVVTATIEGSRPVLVEAQGLSVVTTYGSPQRTATGYSRKRLSLLLAVLEKRAELPFSQMDAFVNVVGGLTLEDTAGDAAIALALASSAAERDVPASAIVLGEVGLGGEIRRVGQIERRLGEAARLGFETAYVPTGCTPREPIEGLTCVEVDTVSELIRETIGPIGDLAPGPADGDEGGGGQQRQRQHEGRRRQELEL